MERTIRALTICQPYAELIRRGEKRVENRTWDTSYRGLLLIHAGKSEKYLQIDNEHGTHDERYGISLSDMSFGAVVAVAELTDCVRYEPIRSYDEQTLPARLRWIYDHDHADGPFCFVLENVMPLAEPIPCNGKQGLWIPDRDILDRLPLPA